jgi:hypothetical protein
MRRRLRILIFVLLCFFPLPAGTDVPPSLRAIATQESPTGTYRYVDQELLVQPKEGVSIGELSADLSAYSA